MEAFIPCGAPLSSSRAFLTGDRSPLSASTPARPHAPPTMKFAGLQKLVTDKTLTAPAPRAASPYKREEASIAKFYNPTCAQHTFRRNSLGQNATAFDVRVGPNGVKPENARDNDQATFRNMDAYTPSLARARAGWSPSEARAGVRAAIRHIFGNAHLFDSELSSLSRSISCVYETGDMREFVRALGLSSLYRERFFDSVSNMRFVELSFKHFLGRAPYDGKEVARQMGILLTDGYNAAINALVDSGEYDRLFGKERVPAVNFRGGHLYNGGMNKTAILNGAYGASDRVTTKAMLPTGDASDFSAFGVLKGMPEAWRGENGARNAAGAIMSFPDSFFWNAPPSAMSEAELEWRMRYGSWSKFWYKDSAVYKEVMQPKLRHSAEEEAEAAAVLKYGSSMAKSYQYAK